MDFLAPTNVFHGVLQLENDPTADNHAVTRQYLEANAVVGIATDSANYAELVTVNGEKQLKLKPLTITDVAVDTVATSISNWVSSNYTNGDEKQEGDIIILTNVTGRAQSWIHNGGVAGTAADFTEIEGQDVSDAEVRAALSASAGIDYNSATGEFTADQAEIRGFFAAGSGLSYSSANGTFSFSADTDGVSEGSSNLYFTDARARGAIGVSGAGLSYNSSTGVIDLAMITDDITEDVGATNLFFTDARARGAVSITGAGLSYTSSTGVFELTADTDDIGEGSTNQYFTDARARGAISLATVASPDVQLLQYNSSTGALSVELSDIFSQFTAGDGLSYSNGEYALNADTDKVTEGSANLYFTDARAQTAISADASADNLAQYDNTKGEILVDINDFRKEFAPQNLTANTFATLNHGLGKKIIHVSAYDSSGNQVQLDVQLVDANNVKVKSVINVTGAEIVVSI
jgi:hypothetical protein